MPTRAALAVLAGPAPTAALIGYGVVGGLGLTSQHTDPVVSLVGQQYWPRPRS